VPVASELYEPIVSQSVPHAIHQKILKLVEEKRLVVGERLPPERELATTLRVSRTSLRDALRSLAEHGVLESRQGAGWFVTSDDLIVVRGAARRYQQSDLALEQMVEARLLVEPAIAAYAAMRRTKEDLKSLNKLLHDLDSTTDTRRYVRLDMDLHLLIVQSAHNGYLSLVVQPLIDRMADARRDLRPVLPTAPSVAEHHKIVSAIQLGDANAARAAMKRHLGNFKRRTSALFNDVGSASV
jgi:GntR family transcriptional regulator, transcriptional repressor for pyruvate dehydrogenase complex